MSFPYVYIESERWQDEHGYVNVTYTVGFYDPSGAWHAETDYSDAEEAAKRVAWLNGKEGEKGEPRFEPGQRVKVRVSIGTQKPGTVERVVDTPVGRFYNVKLDKPCFGNLGGIVQVRGEIIEAL